MENLSEEDFEQRDNSSNATATGSATSVREYRAAVLLWTVWPPCVIVLGSWGNIATIFVMRRIKDHNSSQYAILMALAMSDLLFLNSGVSREWIRHVFRVEIRVLHTWVCKLHKWTLYGVSTSSAWLVTCVTVQRTMAVLWPHRMRMVCTVRRTWMVITVLVLTAFLIHSHIIFGLEITRENRCDSRPGVYEYFYRQIFMWMDTCISNLLPCVLLFVCDIILSLTLFRSTSVSSATVHTISSFRKNDGRRKTASRTTVMVLALSFTFLVLTMPVYVFYAVWYQDVDAFILQTAEALAGMKLVSTLTHLLWYSNSAINFFLYCLTGSKYRTEFVHWMLCRPPSPSPSSYSSSSSAAAVACVGGGRGGPASGGRDKQQHGTWAA